MQSLEEPFKEPFVLPLYFMSEGNRGSIIALREYTVAVEYIHSGIHSCVKPLISKEGT